jgi:DNA ligase-1
VNVKKPMLAGKLKDFGSLEYPVLCTPKLDGVRALKVNGELVSRNFKLIPNVYTRERFDLLPDGVDGELILNNGTEAGDGFNNTQSAVMREDGEPDVLYYIFDYVEEKLSKPYDKRMEDLASLNEEYEHIVIVFPVWIHNKPELLSYEQTCLSKGYEGVMIRDPKGQYKEGRSTEKEGYLLKLKRFEDSEAYIVGFEEKLHNENPKEKDAFGDSKRSAKKEGLVPAGTLGKIYVRDVDSGIEFEIGTGFNDELRQEIWDHQHKYLGKVVKYKYQSCGMKEKPRFPVFLAFEREGKR